MIKEYPEDCTPALKAKFYRILIYTLNKSVYDSLHPVHPFKMIKWCPTSWKTFVLIPDYCIPKSFTQLHLRNMKGLFYNFGLLRTEIRNGDICPLCSTCIYPKTDSLEKHLTIDCMKLSNYRGKYFAKVHHLLRKIYIQPNKCHNLAFGQSVLRTIENFHNHEQQIWQLYSGANATKFNPNTHKFQFIHTNVKWNKNNTEYSEFYIALLKHLSYWYNDIIHIAKEPTKYNIQNKADRIPAYTYNRWYHQWIHTNEEFIQLLEDINYNVATDALISTDASGIKDIRVPIDSINPPEMKDDFNPKIHNKYCGIGIHIQINNQMVNFHQAMGKHTVNFSEMFAPGQANYVLQRWNQRIKPQRMIYVTDSAFAYTKIYTKPNLKKDTYPEHQQQIQDTIWKHKQVMLIKVAAHLTEKKQTAIIVNDTADALAKLGSEKSRLQNISATPSLNHWDFSSCWSYDPLGCRSEPVHLWDDSG